MKKRIKRTIKILVFLLLGFLLLWYVTKDQDTEKIVYEIRNANYWWVFLSMLLGLTSHFFRALRWNLLISTLGYKTKTSLTFYALMTGYLFNLVVPRMGEITRCGILHKSSNVSFSILFGTVLSERFFDMVCLLLLIIATVMLQVSFLRVFIGEYIFYPLIYSFKDNYLLFLAAFIVIVVAGITLYAFYKNWVKHAKPNTRMSWLKMQIKGMMSGIKTIRYMPKKWTFLFHTLMIWINYFLMVYVVFFAIHGTSHLGLIEGLTVLALGSIGIVAPVPGGIGTYHFIVIRSLTELYNIIPEYAASYAYVAHASQILMMLSAGIISVLVITFAGKRITILQKKDS